MIFYFDWDKCLRWNLTIDLVKNILRSWAEHTGKNEAFYGPGEVDQLSSPFRRAACVQRSKTNYSPKLHLKKTMNFLYTSERKWKNIKKYGIHLRFGRQKVKRFFALLSQNLMSQRDIRKKKCYKLQAVIPEFFSESLSHLP